MKNNDAIHPDLLAALKLAYEPCGLTCTNIIQGPESQEYAACEFKINDQRIKFRVAKITPTKIGQFVTIWKRIGSGPIMPFDMADPVDLFVISVRSGKRLGQFVFPKAVLQKKGFVSLDGKGGKRAMRVYPAWDKPTSKQAQKTQDWQLKYFFEIDAEKRTDTNQIRKLFS